MTHGHMEHEGPPRQRAPYSRCTKSASTPRNETVTFVGISKGNRIIGFLTGGAKWDFATIHSD